MKILCVIDSLNSGGAQRQMVALARGFKEKGHQVQVLTYHKLNFFKPHLDEYEIPVKTIEEPNYLKRILKIRRAIRHEKPDAVLSFLVAANFYATLAGFPKRPWRLVVGERNAEPNLAKSFKSLFFRFFHLFADKVVANSHANLELVKKANPFLNVEKMEVIYNIVKDIQGLKIEQKNSAKIHIVVAARYAPQKNIEGLIEAVSRLSDFYKNRLRIDWYGQIESNINYFKIVEKKANDLNLENVLFFHDRTNQIFENYKTADFVGLFSHYEGFPNTICEAMALGKPVIATCVSDVPIFIKENKNGFLCHADKTNSIRDALVRAIDSTEENRQKIGENNQQLAKEKFKKEIITNQYLKMLKN